MSINIYMYSQNVLFSVFHTFSLFEKTNTFPQIHVPLVRYKSSYALCMYDLQLYIFQTLNGLCYFFRPFACKINNNNKKKKFGINGVKNEFLYQKVKSIS